MCSYVLLVVPQLSQDVPFYLKGFINTFVFELIGLQSARTKLDGLLKDLVDKTEER